MNRPREIEHLLSGTASGAAAVLRPQPLYLPAAGHLCAAWWHAPAEAKARPLAVVLAGSWGDEELASHDDVRALALRLAGAGFGVVRLEWPDMGDSSAASGSTGVSDALAALEAAAKAARSLSGLGRLAFVGVRLGALLAAHAAVARRDVGALVAIAPVGSGGAFLRESGMQAETADAAVTHGDGDGMQVGGFLLPQTRAIEWASLTWPVGRVGGLTQVLVIPEPATVANRCVEAFEALGASVTLPTEPPQARGVRVGESPFIASIEDPAVVRWLEERAPKATSRAVEPHLPVGVAAWNEPAWLRTTVEGARLREQVCEVAMPRANGELSPPLAAVLTQRDRPDAPDGLGAVEPARRGLVLVSTAGGRRVGPHRLWTEFARERAAQGEVVLRIDLAGTGDSAPRSPHEADRAPQPYDSRCVDDIARAIAWLRREHGVGPCAVVGFGTGAHHAWRTAVLGIDVQQVVAINPGAFHWPAERTPEEMLALAGDPTGWRALPGVASFRRRVKLLEARADRLTRSLGREVARALGWRLVDDLAAELEFVARRGVAVDFVFSRGEPSLADLREDGGSTARALVRTGALRILELAPREPTFASAQARATLLARLHALLSSAGGPTSAPTYS